MAEATRLGKEGEGQGSHAPTAKDGHSLRDEKGHDFDQHPKDPYLLFEPDAQV